MFSFSVNLEVASLTLPFVRFLCLAGLLSVPFIRAYYSIGPSWKPLSSVAVGSLLPNSQVHTYSLCSLSLTASSYIIDPLSISVFELLLFLQDCSWMKVKSEQR